MKAFSLPLKPQHVRFLVIKYPKTIAQCDIFHRVLYLHLKSLHGFVNPEKLLFLNNASSLVSLVIVGLLVT